jgi:hypothetical protein
VPTWPLRGLHDRRPGRRWPEGTSAASWSSWRRWCRRVLCSVGWCWNRECRPWRRRAASRAPSAVATTTAGAALSMETRRPLPTRPAARKEPRQGAACRTSVLAARHKRWPPSVSAVGPLSTRVRPSVIEESGQPTDYSRRANLKPDDRRSVFLGLGLCSNAHALPEWCNKHTLLHVAALHAHGGLWCVWCIWCVWSVWSVP